jgi:hypothetical protein
MPDVLPSLSGVAPAAVDVGIVRHRGMYWVVGLLTAAVLMYTVAEQIFDTNFYVLWEATALLAGDHPYRAAHQRHGTSPASHWR